MANYKSEYYRFNGTGWDLYYFRTSIDQVVGLQTALDGKANTSHTHNASDINAGTLADARIPSLGISKITNLQPALDNRIIYDDVIMPTNPFGGKKLYINAIDNALYAADRRFTVTATRHLKVFNGENYPMLNPNYVASYTITGSGNVYTITDNPKPNDIVVFVNDTLCSQVALPGTSTQFNYDENTGVITFGATPSGTIYVHPGPTITQFIDSPVTSTLSSGAVANFFDGSYETSQGPGSADHYMKIRISAGPNGRTLFQSFNTYSYGTFYLSYYYAGTADKAEYRVYNLGFRPHGIGWKKMDFTDYIGNNNQAAHIQSVTDGGNHGRSIMEFIIYGKTPNPSFGSYQTGLTQIDWKLSQPNLSKTGSTVTKYGVNKLFYQLIFGTATSDNVIIDPAGSITIGGQSVILNNDARLSNARTPLAHVHAAGDVTSGQFDVARIPTLPYIPIAGGTLNGDLIIERLGGGSFPDTPSRSIIFTARKNSSDLTRALYVNSDGALVFHNNALIRDDDPRLSDSRIASDVYSWAKAANKPTYTYTEVGAAAASHNHPASEINDSTTLGRNLIKLANINTSNKYLRINFTDNSVSAIEAATLRSEIGAPPTSHATNGNTYGYGDTTNAGHLRVGAGLDVSNGTVSRSNLGTPATISSSTTLAIATHANKTVLITAGSAATITIPANSSVAFPIGTQIDFIQTGAGEITFAITSDTLVSEGNKRKINAQYQAVTLIKTAATTWVLVGALKS